MIASEEPLTLPTFGVDIVCLAFSVELYLKALYKTLKLEIPRKHNIRELFDGLPERVRGEIFESDVICQNPFHTRGNIMLADRFSKNFKPYDGFLYEVDAISKGFEEWRYSYEYLPLRYNTSFALDFIEAIKSVAEKKRRRSLDSKSSLE